MRVRALPWVTPSSRWASQCFISPTQVLQQFTDAGGNEGLTSLGGGGGANQGSRFGCTRQSVPPPTALIHGLVIPFEDYIRFFIIIFLWIQSNWFSHRGLFLFSMPFLFHASHKKPQIVLIQGQEPFIPGRTGEWPLVARQWQTKL